MVKRQRLTLPPSKTKHKNIEQRFESRMMFPNVEIITGERFKMFYKINTPPKKRLADGRLLKMKKLFFKIIRDDVTRNTAGVFIKNFGYFYMQQSPIPLKRRKMHKFFLRRPYALSFAPIRKDKKLDTWSIERANFLEEGSHKRILRVKDKMYKNAYTSLHSMHGLGSIVIHFKEYENDDK